MSLTVSFIGGGVMAEAMIKGLLNLGVVDDPTRITAGEIDAARRDYLSATYGVQTTADNLVAVEGNAGLIVVALKPQHIQALEGLRGGVHPDSAVVSIAAGVRIGAISGLLGSHPAIVRVMPNTPAQVGQGMSVWTATPGVTEPQRASVEMMLGALGKQLYVAGETYLDMATALSGSGPGYVFLFLEALIDAGVHVGLPRDQAELMARQTLLGSAVLASESPARHVAELRNMVTSPGGTTAEGLRALEEAGLRAAVIEAVVAAFEKSRALG